MQHIFWKSYNIPNENKIYYSEQFNNINIKCNIKNKKTLWYLSFLHDKGLIKEENIEVIYTSLLFINTWKPILIEKIKWNQVYNNHETLPDYLFDFDK